MVDTALPCEAKQLLTIFFSYDMYRDIEEKMAEGKNVKYADRYICGLPVGLQLPNGVVIGASA